MSSELDDLTLARARKGDAGACRALVRCYERRVFALLGRMLEPRGMHAQVEDAAQETFLRVFAHLKRFRADGPARLSTWILTIATRHAIDLIRRHGRERPLEAAPTLVAPDRPDQQVMGRALLRTIGKLPAEQQAVFLLRATEDLDYAEIAAALQIELGTVRSRLSRARSTLRRLLAKERS